VSRSFLAPTFFVLLWSSGFVVARLVAGHAEPASFLSIRYALAALGMWLIALVMRERVETHHDRLQGMIVGVFMYAGYLVPIYWAVTLGLPAGVSALIVGLQPLLTAFLAGLVLHERVTGKHWLALCIGFCGVALVLWPKFSVAASAGITPLTVGMALFGMTSATVGTVYQKKFAAHLPLVPSVMWQFIGAAVATTIVAALLEDFQFDGSPQFWFGLVWAVLVASIVTILLFTWMIREGSVSRVATLIFLVPGCTALMTYFLFGETLSVLQLIGMALTAAAVIIVNKLQ
jgi:drug/metabolite transporter (DMT)-like permease